MSSGRSSASLSLVPQPHFGYTAPERDVREHDNRGVRARAAFDVVFEPFQWVVAERPEACRPGGPRTLTSPMKWTPFLLKAVPAGALALDALQVPLAQ